MKERLREGFSFIGRGIAQCVQWLTAPLPSHPLARALIVLGLAAAPFAPFEWIQIEPVEAWRYPLAGAAIAGACWVVLDRVVAALRIGSLLAGGVMDFSGAATPGLFDGAVDDGLSRQSVGRRLIFEALAQLSDLLQPRALLLGKHLHKLKVFRRGQVREEGPDVVLSRSHWSAPSCRLPGRRSKSRGTSRQSASASATSRVTVDTVGEAETVGRGKSFGTSETQGTSEVFVTRYELLPMQMYSLEEQLHRLTGELKNLPRRECCVKHEGERPFRTRTADLAPAFRSAYFQRMMVPIYLKGITARSQYLVPTADADAAIEARFAGLLKPPPTPDPGGAPNGLVSN